VHAAPITAMLLGDYGAEVIKVEHPRGDPPAPTGGTATGTAYGGRSSPATSRP
jgi:crotonobetainyl-CoA:carnitine CoA-transferase CaiB-like acyl-CoA transferase